MDLGELEPLSDLMAEFFLVCETVLCFFCVVSRGFVLYIYCNN